MLLGEDLWVRCLQEVSKPQIDVQLGYGSTQPGLLVQQKDTEILMFSSSVRYVQYHLKRNPPPLIVNAMISVVLLRTSK